MAQRKREGAIVNALVGLLVYILNTIFAVLVFCFAIVWIPLVNIAEYFDLFGLKSKDK